MPFETLEIGKPTKETLLGRLRRRLGPRAPAWALVVTLVAAGFGSGVLLSHLAHRPPDGERGQTTRSGLRPAEDPVTAEAMRPPPWVTGPRPALAPVQFSLVNRTSHTVFVSTPPKFVFTVPARGRLSFARLPVCAYQRFTARLADGRVLGTIEDFCEAEEWLLLRTGRAVLR